MTKRGPNFGDAPYGTPYADTSAAEAEKAARAEISAEKPPKGLFEHTGKVLVEHKGEKLLLPEGELRGHMGHGDRILDPTGRSGEEGRR